MDKTNKKYNIEEVKEDFERKDYTLVSTEYKNKDSQLDYICNKHKELGIQHISYASFKLHKNNCSGCKSENLKENWNKIHASSIKKFNKDEMFKKYSKKVYETVDDEYKLFNVYKENGKTMLDLIHKDCGEHYNVEQGKFLNRNNRCQNKECKFKRRSLQKLKPRSQVLKEIKDLVGDEYLVSGEYTGTNNNMQFQHNIPECNHSFPMTPHNFIQGGQRCPVCANKIRAAHLRKTNEKFDKEIKELFGDEYERLTDYINTFTQIKFLHKKCKKTFTVTPSGILYNGNRKTHIICPYCFREYLTKLNAKTQEEYEEQIFDRFGNEYTILNEYINWNTTMSIRHNVCNRIFQIGANRMYYTLNPCPFCERPSKGEHRIIDYLDSFMKDEYTYQQYYEELVGINGGLLSYDFYLPKYNLLIEYQGEFHDGTVGFQTPEDFERQKEHDRRKREYANSYGIDLLEIWYWDYDNIEDIIYNYLREKEQSKIPVKIKYMHKVS